MLVTKPSVGAFGVDLRSEQHSKVGISASRFGSVPTRGPNRRLPRMRTVLQQRDLKASNIARCTMARARAWIGVLPRLLAGGRSYS